MSRKPECECPRMACSVPGHRERVHPSSLAAPVAPEALAQAREQLPMVSIDAQCGNMTASRLLDERATVIDLRRQLAADEEEIEALSRTLNDMNEGLLQYEAWLEEARSQLGCDEASEVPATAKWCIEKLAAVDSMRALEAAEFQFFVDSFRSELATERQRADRADKVTTAASRTLEIATTKLEASEAKRKALREALEREAEEHKCVWQTGTPQYVEWLDEHAAAHDRIEAALAADSKDTP